MKHYGQWSDELDSALKDLQVSLDAFKPLEVKLDDCPIIEIAKIAGGHLEEIVEIYDTDEFDREDLDEINELVETLHDDLDCLWSYEETDLPEKLEKLQDEMEDLSENDFPIMYELLKSHFENLEESTSGVISVLHDILENTA
ncbi:hypothetical protein [Marinobacter sp. S6332]|uniref:hypothetical protein n=1 Tax=Marinobacter sp. S6332 TaxID=2926403 RepID=UPI001FF38941|nr:hypothetical protein [Marinobacter sp. S6332]MCK0165875.1 hypothetical protein [Marinobacter sp. S6332]